MYGVEPLMRSLLGYGFLAPPNIFIALCPLGVLLALRWWRIGLFITAIASCCLYVAATPAFSSYLLAVLESEVPATTDFSSAQAIVVLGADFRFAGDKGAARLGPQSIERLMFTAEAYRKLQLPVAVSGGPVLGQYPPVAGLMKAALEGYFNVPITWVEDRSRTTHENALYTAEVLRAANIHRVVVITQPRDTPRVIWSFKKAGLDPLPWSTPIDVAKNDEIEDFLPTSTALNETFYGLHEFIGALYYRTR
jgi:uncharacterized SAM-binding protein YcdF (DUF218 family)